MHTEYIPPVSVSGCKKAKRCARSWAFRDIAGHPGSSGKGAEESSRAHKIAEKYLKTGEIPDLTIKEGRWFLKCLHLLPKPGTVLVERPFAFWAFGIEWHGYKDWQCVDRPLTGDHKFLADVVARSLDSAALMRDDQAMLYALDTCILFGSEYAELDWIWYPKNKQAPRRTYLSHVPLEHCYRHVETELVPIARYLRDLRRFFAPVLAYGQEYLTARVNEDITRNQGACFDYNTPCPYLQICK